MKSGNSVDRGKETMFTQGMNASQLHCWVLKNLTTLEHASTDRQGQLIGSDAEEHEFWMEAGRHKGLIEASGLLLDLIAEMQAAERATTAAGLEDIGLCDMCGSEEGERTRKLIDGITAWVCSTPACQPDRHSPCEMCGEVMFLHPSTPSPGACAEAESRQRALDYQ